MAFEKVEHISSRITCGTSTVHIRMAGQIYLGGIVVNDYPITNEYRSADFFIDIEEHLVAVLPLKEITGHFRISSGNSGKHISCSRFLDTYNIERNQKCLCTIKDVDGKRMIVFKVERSPQ